MEDLFCLISISMKSHKIKDAIRVGFNFSYAFGLYLRLITHHTTVTSYSNSNG